MPIRKRICMLLFTAGMLCVMGLAVCAHDVPDLSRTGSVTVKMHQGESVVSGGTLTLYQAGSVYEDDGNYSFAPAGGFADCGESLEEIQSAALAKKLAAYAKNNNLTGTTKMIDENGKVLFTGLKPGLYLLVQNSAANGYKTADPFLVSIPMLDNGVYLYDVDASPKVGTLETEKQTEEETEPVTEKGKETGKKGTSSKTTLPQTGQLNWPIPVLTALGLALIAVGWILRFEKRKKGYEE